MLLTACRLQAIQFYQRGGRCGVQRYIGRVAINNERIVWIDCEMTGLDAVNDALIEVAALVTDSELNILGDGVDVVIKPSDEALAQMGDFVRNMHTSSKLIDELAGGTTMEDAQAQVLAYIQKHVPQPNKAPLAGNSIGTDKVFLSRDMPELVEHLHYRVIDVSTIKELSRRWYTARLLPVAGQDGRAPRPGRHHGQHQRAQVLP